MIIKTIPAAPPVVRKPQVAAYCRVSTMLDEQVDSLQAQVSYYIGLISRNPRWIFSGVFADRASGRNMQKMHQFGEMINACREHEIDIIVTKSVSRFGRNTLQSLLAFRELIALDIDIYFEIENLHLLNLSGMLMLTIFAGIAQDESETKSANIRWGLCRDFESGKSKLINRPCYGYRKSENGDLVIESDEAKIVRQIFHWRSNGDSLRTISMKLKEIGIASPRDKKTWGTETLNKLLANEKYTGNVLLQKTFVKDYFNAKQSKNAGELPRYFIHCTHPEIISTQQFERINTGFCISQKQ